MNVDTPITIEITEEELEALADGETKEVELDTDAPGTDALEVAWSTYMESEGAGELNEELVELFK